MRITEALAKGRYNKEIAPEEVRARAGRRGGARASPRGQAADGSKATIART